MLGSDSDYGAMNVEHLQGSALNGVEVICSIVSMPVEMVLRPRYGSRFFSVPVAFGSGVMMLLLPAMVAVWTSVMQMIPFGHYAPPPGMFDFASMTKLYFLLCIVHGVRIWRRMIHPETEEHSQYEGPPLPFFAILPKSQSFWFTRIILEPCFVFLAATVLEDLFIVQSGVGTYLHIAALALGMKNFVSWFRSWEFLRKILDLHISGPAIAKLVEDTATEEDLAPMHLASFPKNVAPDIRRAAAMHIARSYSLENLNIEENQKGESL
jgi:hypothetical protein